VALARPEKTNATTDAVVTAISEHNAVRDITATAPGPSESKAEAIREQLKKGRQDYFTTYMDRARQKLKKALLLARRTYAEGITPEELAEIHLYLAAVSDATHKPRQKQGHLDAAVRFFPALELDPSIFSPKLRKALEKRLAARETSDLQIRTTPPGATITWNGKEMGKAPVTLPAQGKGEHFLVARHPLARARRERIVVTTSAQLELKLEPAPAGEVVTALRHHPEHAAAGLGLLGVNVVVWVDPTEDGGAVVRSLSRSGSREVQVAQGTGAGGLKRVARSLPRDPSQPTVPTPSPKKKKGGKKERTRRWGKYWWAWTAVGVVLVGTAVAVPLALRDGSDPTSRPVVMDIPK
jgi:hypothetical protein